MRDAPEVILTDALILSDRSEIAMSNREECMRISQIARRITPFLETATALAKGTGRAAEDVESDFFFFFFSRRFHFPRASNGGFDLNCFARSKYPFLFLLSSPATFSLAFAFFLELSR